MRYQLHDHTSVLRLLAPGAIIADSAEIGPYAVIGSQVSIGAAAKLAPM